MLIDKVSLMCESANDLPHEQWSGSGDRDRLHPSTFHAIHSSCTISQTAGLFLQHWMYFELHLHSRIKILINNRIHHWYLNTFVDEERDILIVGDVACILIKQMSLNSGAFVQGGHYA